VVDVCHFVSSFNRLGRAAAAFLALETKTKRNGKWRIAVSRKESAISIFNSQFSIPNHALHDLVSLSTAKKR
jgi:hypothetical protein